MLLQDTPLVFIYDTPLVFLYDTPLVFLYDTPLVFLYDTPLVFLYDFPPFLGQKKCMVVAIYFELPGFPSPWTVDFYLFFTTILQNEEQWVFFFTSVR